MSIQTPHGIVHLRGPGSRMRTLEVARNKRHMQDYELRPTGPNEKVKVTRDWLKVAKGGKVDHKAYRLHVMQCMRIAAYEMEIQDLAVVNRPNDQGGRNPMAPGTMKREIEKQMAGMKDGVKDVQIREVATNESGIAEMDRKEHLKRYEMRKMQRKTNRWTTRYFRIDGSRLYVYKTKHPSNVSKNVRVYSLKEGTTCIRQDKGHVDTGVPWPQGKTDRLRLEPPERQHGPLFLYAENTKQAKSWERAIKLAKHVSSAQSREALSVCVGRVAGNVLQKGWQALFQYKRELEETKRLMQSLGMKMMQVELSKGWNKMRLLYQQKTHMEKHRQAQRALTLKLLSEGLTSSSQKPARSPQAVRYSIVSDIQRKFSILRQEKIFHREYPLGNQPLTRMQQAHSAKLLGSFYTSLAFKDAWQLTMDAESMSMLETAQPGTLESQRKTYSETNQAVGWSNVNVSDSLAMLSFTEADDGEEGAKLGASAWANFVNLDEISSVVLHSERRMNHNHKGQPELDIKMCHGTWLTINGPRVGWARKLQARTDTDTKAKTKVTVGVPNGLALGRDLLQGEKVEWLLMKITVRASNIPKVAPSAEEETLRASIESQRGQQASQPPKEWATYLVLNFLGQQFRSKQLPGNAPVYQGAFEASVPIGRREGLASLDETLVTVEVVEWNEEPKLCRTMWAGKIALWKLFSDGKRTLAERVENTAEKATEVLGAFRGPLEEEVETSLTQSMSSGTSVAPNKRIDLVHPGAASGTDILHHAYLDIDANARVSVMNEPARKPVSPELQGRGSLTALWSTHRGLWYDPLLGPSKFMADKVASFLEIKIDQLAIPVGDRDQGVWRYHIEAKCQGVTVSTVALHRPTADWKGIIQCDENIISWQGARLYVPLPPGCWRSQDAKLRPVVEIAVYKAPEEQGMDKTMSYREFLTSNGKPPALGMPSLTKAYHAVVRPDGLLLNSTVSGMSVPLTSARGDPVPVRLNDGYFDPSLASSASAQITCDVVLRDRDFVRLHMATRSEDTRLGAQSVICVGDKATLKVEEPILYPRDENEHRKRYFPGTYDKSLIGRQTVQKLRDPFMSHEHALSGLERLEATFKQRNLQGTNDDILPHRFVLPTTEQAHLETAKPGVYWRILNDLAAQARQQQAQGQQQTRAGKPPPQIVGGLSHLVKHVPVTVIAVYANNTCDVEVAPIFLNEWERHPERVYAIPGSVVIKEFKHEALQAVRSAPVGTGDVGSVVRRRVFLREVPLSTLFGVQSSSFNVYDAALPSVDEAMKVHPAESRNDFNPRDSNEMPSGTQALGGYSISAGPVPADATLTCQYEWSLHLHMPSDEDAYHFITALRQCVRMDLFQQVQKMREYKAKQKEASTGAKYHMGRVYTTATGHLEVVLVEARNLRPPKVQKLPMSMAAVGEERNKYWDELNRVANREYSPFVTFRLQSEIEDMMFRGSIKQQSMSIQNTNCPNWSTQKELLSSAGWVFKTPQLDPADMPNLFFEMEVMHKSSVSLGAQPVGKVRVPVTEKQTVPPDEVMIAEREIAQMLARPEIASVDNDLRAKLKPAKKEEEDPMLHVWRRRRILQSIVSRGLTSVEEINKFIQTMVADFQTMPSPGIMHRNLCDPKAPFNNLWLPLSHFVDGQLVNRESGELHIMTLWVMDQPDRLNRRLPTSARNFLAYDLRPSMVGNHKVREPLFDIQTKKVGYNPNSVKWPDFPESHADVLCKHIEQVHSTVPYLICLANQSTGKWKSFYKPFLDETGEWKSFAQRRAEADLVQVFKMDDLLRRGVPVSWRMAVWLDVTNARQYMVMVNSVGNLVFTADRFKNLIEFGAPFMNEAILQLQEDMVGAASWETSKAPAHLSAHMAKLRRAQRVCIALINFSLDLPAQQDQSMSEGERDVRTNFNYKKVAEDKGEKPVGVAYCESLLVLAFFLLLVQAPLKETPKAPMPPEPEELGKLKDKVYGRSRRKEDPDLEAEFSAFWLLYTLIGSPSCGEFREYYGMKKGKDPKPPLATKDGAMLDVLRLDKALATNERELWIHLNGLGFHLSVVFYGAFMRLFAFILPSASLFRLWDHIISESTKAKYDPTAAVNTTMKPRRHVLIDFAYAVVQQCKPLLQQCESAIEARDCLINYLEGLYDPSKVIELCAGAEIVLWEGVMQQLSLPMMPDHWKNFDNTVNLYESHYLPQFVEQNRVLRELVREPHCHLPMGEANSRSQVALDGRITTANIRMIVVPVFNRLFDGTARNKYGNMYRTSPQTILEDGPPVDTTVVGSVRRLFDKAGNMLHGSGREISNARMQDLPLGTKEGEPSTLSVTEFTSNLQRGFPPFSRVGGIAEFFKSEEAQNHVSLNEFLMALICASKGTVGEKALALFHLFGYNGGIGNMKHISPVTHQASAIVEKVDGFKAEQLISRRPPDQADLERTTALHFTIETHNPAGGNMVLGEVFIPSLQPFVYSTMGGDFPQPFTIWGRSQPLPPGSRQPGDIDQNRVRPYIGTLNMAIKWMPVSREEPHKGQLGIHVYEIKFDNSRVETPKLKNPKIKVCTYKADSAKGFVPQEIPRWDPRGVFRKAGAAASINFAYGGAYGHNLEWEETMWRDPLHTLHPHHGAGAGHGWNSQKSTWEWSTKWGDQYSVKDFEFRKELTAVVKGPDTISLQACRIITQHILNRGLHTVSNRYASLLSDSIFSRAGVVPGILDAVLIDASNVKKAAESVKKLRDQLREDKAAVVDVKYELVLAHEKGVTQQLGALNLFPDDPSGSPSPQSLHGTLKVSDPFPGKNKQLWIRYCRAGDGERYCKVINIDGDGVLRSASEPMRISQMVNSIEVPMDIPNPRRRTADAMMEAQYAITKEEFVSCMLASPLLSETLRQLSTSDSSMAFVPHGNPIALWVEATDPSSEALEEDIMDTLNVRQGVLLEVWDYDRGQKDDFLGECWLPDLGTLQDRPQQFVLPVRKAPLYDKGEGETRPDPAKFTETAQSSDPLVMCKGNLYVEASWRLPAQPPDDAQEEAAAKGDRQARVAREERLHTGELYLRILKAEGLRSADKKLSTSGDIRKASSDPYVRAYVKNQAEMGSDKGWKTNPVTGVVETLLRTGYKSRTVNPNYTDDAKATVKVQLQTGAFAKRVQQGHFKLDVTQRQRQRSQMAHEQRVLNDQAEISIFFGHTPDPAKGPRPEHRVDVYLGDTIHLFKLKLREACKQEAMRCPADDERKAKFEALSKKIDHRHIVTFWSPSAKLRELHQAGRTASHEFRTLREFELNDPSSWQPLDDTRTFNDYKAIAGFGGIKDGRPEEVRLKVTEVNDAYFMKNHQFREFDEKRKAMNSRIEETNNDKACFGYVRYEHQSDGPSFEWRPALLQKVETQTDRQRFKAEYLYARPNANRAGARGLSPEEAAIQAMHEEVDQDRVVLAPAHPKFLGSGDFIHQDLLMKAPKMFEQGMSEKDIADNLNKTMMADFDKNRQQIESATSDSAKAFKPTKPTLITAAEVRSYLREHQPSAA